MGVSHAAPYDVMEGDPDDHRPGSTWLLQVDPGGRTAMAVIRESIGVGDRIPRHVHDVDEVILVERGTARAYVDGDEQDVSEGDTVFIPAGAVHGTVNTGSQPVEVRGVFPSARVRMDYVERNPAPGTEDHAPRSVVYDFATGGFEVLGEVDR